MTLSKLEKAAREATQEFPCISFRQTFIGLNDGEVMLASFTGPKCTENATYLHTANPKTILSMCELIREQHEALVECAKSRTASGKSAAQAIQKFQDFERGE